MLITCYEILEIKHVVLISKPKNIFIGLLIKNSFHTLGNCLSYISIVCEYAHYAIVIQVVFSKQFIEKKKTIFRSMEVCDKYDHSVGRIILKNNSAGSIFKKKQPIKVGLGLKH